MKPASRHTDALIRDLAQLFVKYKADAWRPILAQLLEGGESQSKIANIIQRFIDDTILSTAKTSAEDKKKRRRLKTRAESEGAAQRNPVVARSKDAMVVFSEGRSEVLNALGKEIADRSLLPAASDIRKVFLLSGGKGELPRGRKASTLLLLRHLDKVSEELFVSTLSTMKKTTSADDNGAYARWFNLIKAP